ncbi:phosphate acyltransferase, partial [Staphylococcus aureus]
SLGVPMRPEYELLDTRTSPHIEEFTEHLYARLQRRGYLKRDCLRLVTNERNVFAALMVAHGYADAMVSGSTRNWTSVARDIR